MSDTKRKWCAMLAKLTAPMHPEEAAKGFVNMLPMLPEDDAAFNRDTLERAARRELGDPAVPNFDTISRAFAKWNRDNRPAAQQLGANPEVLRIAKAITPREPISPEESAAIDVQIEAMKAEFSARAPAKEGGKVEPKYLNKLQLALTSSPETLAIRPDLRAALEKHEREMEG